MSGDYSGKPHIDGIDGSVQKPVIPGHPREFLNRLGRIVLGKEQIQPVAQV
jgi:hypothetical protein